MNFPTASPALDKFYQDLKKDYEPQPADDDDDDVEASILSGASSVQSRIGESGLRAPRRRPGKAPRTNAPLDDSGF